MAVPPTPASSPLDLSTSNFLLYDPDSFFCAEDHQLSFSAHAITLAATDALKSSRYSSPPASVGFAVGGHDDGTRLQRSEQTRDRKRPRTTSPSSTDREVSVEVKPPRKDSSDTACNSPVEPKSNPKKRPSVSGDTVDYPRRRATIAVS
jgi:hypothetical protein